MKTYVVDRLGTVAICSAAICLIILLVLACLTRRRGTIIMSTQEDIKLRLAVSEENGKKLDFIQYEIVSAIHLFDLHLPSPPKGIPTTYPTKPIKPVLPVE